MVALQFITRVRDVMQQDIGLCQGCPGIFMNFYYAIQFGNYSKDWNNICFPLT